MTAVDWAVVNDDADEAAAAAAAAAGKPGAQKPAVPVAAAKPGAAKGKVTVHLNSSDKLYAEIRDTNIDAAGCVRKREKQK